MGAGDDERTHRRMLHTEGRLMRDLERAAVARYKLDSKQLLRDHRRLVTRLAFVDRALERCAEPERQVALRAERARITGVLADTRTRLRACWDRSRFDVRRDEYAPLD